LERDDGALEEHGGMKLDKTHGSSAQPVEKLRLEKRRDTICREIGKKETRTKTQDTTDWGKKSEFSLFTRK